MQEKEKNEPVHQIIIHAGDRNVITTGDNNTVTISYQVFKGDIESLKQALSSNHVSKDDVNEIARIVQEEKPEAGKFGERTKAWIGKMIQKSLDGLWHVGIHTAGALLAEIIKSYHGL
jgi:hypothetical protein